MTERRRTKLAAVSGRSSLSAAEALAAAIPESFQLSGEEVVRFDVDPWLALTYAYARR